MPWTPLDENDTFPSLGWAVADWIEDNLVVPDGIRAGQAMVLSDDQLQFLVRLLRLRADVEFDPDEELAEMQQRAFVRTSGCMSRPKGTGKSPFCGALAWAFALGPVVFSGWDEHGQPLGRPHPSPWVQVLGVSKDNTVNLWSALLACSEEANGAALKRNYDGIDTGLTRAYLPNGKLEFVTTSAGTREGQRVTFAVMEESGYLTESNGGVRVADTVRRNVAKMGGVSIEITNAFVPGEESFAESSSKAAALEAEGAIKPTGLLYDHREAPPGVNIDDESSLEAGLREVYRDAPWVSISRIVGEFRDPRNKVEDLQRFYLNWTIAAVNAWQTPQDVDLCAIRGLTVPPPRRGDTITLGFDGSRKRARGVTDATALVGCRVSDGHLFLLPWSPDGQLSIWEQPPGPDGYDWSVPRHEVNDAIAWAFGYYNVVGFFADPAKWEDHVTSWTADYGDDLQVRATQAQPIEWWMSGGRAVYTIRATDRLHNSIADQVQTVDPESKALLRHLKNARRRASTQGIEIAKAFPTSPDKIDAAVAAVLAYQARAIAVAKGIGEDTEYGAFSLNVAR